MVQYAIVLGVIMKKNINKLVRYYCTKIDYYTDTHFKGLPVSDSTREKIIKSLKIIIEKDREYLLTDSLLDFCTFYGDYDLEIHLHYLSGDYNDVVYCLMFYFLETLEEFLHRIKDNYLSFANMLDKDLQLIMEELARRLLPIEGIKNRGSYGNKDLLNIVCYILANYVVNHKQGDVCEQCDIFLDDPEKTLDSLYLNDIYKDYKRTNYKEDVTNLINYISYKIENSEQKEIK